MRHKVGGYKLQRDESARRSLLRGLVTSVINEERIITTVTKAKAARPLVEKMITLGKKGTLAHRRQAAAFLVTPESVQKLFDKISPRFGNRNGGYTRIVKLGFRKGGPEILEMYAGEAKAALDVLDGHLSGRDWIVGEGASIADIDIYGVLAYAGEGGIDLSPYPNVVAWMSRVEGLPGFAAHDRLLPPESRAAA